MSTRALAHTQPVIQVNLVTINLDIDKTLLLLIAFAGFTGRKLGPVIREFRFLMIDITESLAFIAAVYVIGFKAMAYGLGVAP